MRLVDMELVFFQGLTVTVLLGGAIVLRYAAKTIDWLRKALADESRTKLEYRKAMHDECKEHGELRRRVDRVLAEFEGEVSARAYYILAGVEAEWVIQFRNGGYFQSLEHDASGPLWAAQAFTSEASAHAFMYSAEHAMMFGINGGLAVKRPKDDGNG